MEILKTIISALGGGLFTFLIFIITRSDNKKSSRNKFKKQLEDQAQESLDRYAEFLETKAELDKMNREISDNLAKMMGEMDNIANGIKGSLHNTIIYVGSKYVRQGWVSISDLNDFNECLAEPYFKLGGNGTGHKVWDDVNHLPNIKPREETKNED